ncbi:GDA1/CD39 nucleoside phosphatase family protein [Tasmannia lanceolata]|uniref:GDA1/CD39 nucleoside phosphatase family protein n=1 Tax=Tasmannia lanceolata TaxID=3420 RepID=UPI004063FA12
MRRSNARSPAIDLHPIMDPSKLQSRTNPSRFNLISRFPPSNSKTPKSNHLCIITTALTITFALFFYLFVVARGSKSNPGFSKLGFGIVIDGGSTGTRIHVFEFSKEGGIPVVDFSKGGSKTMRVNPGLSSFSEDPESAGKSLLELLEFGKGKIPKEFWEGTEVRLMATAGLRMLDVGIRERILDSCRWVLRASDFRFQDDWASVITGADEGIYAWIAANYALGTFGGDPQQTTGIIELGGASAQVTFVTSERVPPEFSHTIQFGKFTYNLYSHSLLHFGQNVAYESLHKLLISRDLKLSADSVQEGIFKDPCTPRGYLHGEESLKLSAGVLDANNPTVHAWGNFSECRSAALMLLQKGKDECLYQHCHIGSTFVPELRGKFLATENFFFTTKFFGLPPTAILSNLIASGQQFCEDDWINLKKRYHTHDDEDLQRYCFSSAYIVALLHDSLGVALNDDRISFANEVRDIPLDWALGAFILQKTTDLEEEDSDWINVISDDSSALLSLFIVLAVVVLSAWSVSKWRKPQLKTVYDLEKGRYIVTRVNR